MNRTTGTASVSGSVADVISGAVNMEQRCSVTRITLGFLTVAAVLGKRVDDIIREGIVPGEWGAGGPSVMSGTLGQALVAIR